MKCFDIFFGRLHRQIHGLDIPIVLRLVIHIIVGFLNLLCCGIIGIVMYFVVENRRKRYLRIRDETYAPIGVFRNRKKDGKKGVEKPPLSELLNPKQIEKTDHIFRELLTTERTFVTDLQKLHQWFIKPLVEDEQKIVPRNSPLRACFKKLTTIQRMNQMFLKDLENIVSIENDQNVKKLNDLCRTIIQFSQPFKMYVDYIAGYDSYQEEIRKMMKKNKRFQRVCDSSKKALREEKSRVVDIDSFTITPIQRLPRIMLMMRELGKYVLVECEEYDIFQQAFEVISETSEYCNKKTREIKNIRKLKSIESKYRLKGLLKPYTKIIQEGVAFRVRRSGKGLRSSIVILNDLLVCSPVKKPKDLTWFKKPYIVQLDDVQNTKFEKKDAVDIIVLHMRGKKKKELWLRFDDMTERDKYYNLLVQNSKRIFDEEES